MSWEQGAEDLLKQINRDSYEFAKLWGIHSYKASRATSGNRTGYFLVHQPTRSILTEQRPTIILPNCSPCQMLEAFITAIETAPETVEAKAKHPTEHALVITGLCSFLAEIAPEPYRTDDSYSRDFLHALRNLRH